MRVALVLLLVNCAFGALAKRRSESSLEHLAKAQKTDHDIETGHGESHDQPLRLSLVLPDDETSDTELITEESTEMADETPAEREETPRPVAHRFVDDTPFCRAVERLRAQSTAYAEAIGAVESRLYGPWCLDENALAAVLNTDARAMMIAARLKLVELVHRECGMACGLDYIQPESEPWVVLRALARVHSRVRCTNEHAHLGHHMHREAYAGDVRRAQAVAEGLPHFVTPAVLHPMGRPYDRDALLAVSRHATGDTLRSTLAVPCLPSDLRAHYGQQLGADVNAAKAEETVHEMTGGTGCADVRRAWNELHTRESLTTRQAELYGVLSRVLVRETLPMAVARGAENARGFDAACEEMQTDAWVRRETAWHVALAKMDTGDTSNIKALIRQPETLPFTLYGAAQYVAGQVWRALGMAEDESFYGDFDAANTSPLHAGLTRGHAFARLVGKTGGSACAYAGQWQRVCENARTCMRRNAAWSAGACGDYAFLAHMYGYTGAEVTSEAEALTQLVFVHRESQGHFGDFLDAVSSLRDDDGDIGPLLARLHSA